MVIVTGAAGFIGSCLARKLQRLGKEVVVVDTFNTEQKKAYLEEIPKDRFLELDQLESFLVEQKDNIEFIFHIGARTDTAEFDETLLNRLNLEYTKMIWKRCSEFSIPMLYASSAATYGLGEKGYVDDHGIIPDLKPLNPYGVSKNDFDIWALKQTETPPFWAGFKFFNVYGPNEYHKGRMASVILHAFRQIQETDKMKLFRSHNPDFKDGEQQRDFIYVKDILAILLHFYENQQHSGIYNAGTGKSRTFKDLTLAVFEALGKEPDISFMDTPVDIRDKYQYFTEASTDKLRSAGFDKTFVSLEEGVKEYVQEYLLEGKHF